MAAGKFSFLSKHCVLTVLLLSTNSLSQTAAAPLATRVAVSLQSNNFTYVQPSRCRSLEASRRNDNNIARHVAYEGVETARATRQPQPRLLRHYVAEYLAFPEQPGQKANRNWPRHQSKLEDNVPFIRSLIKAYHPSFSPRYQYHVRDAGSDRRIASSTINPKRLSTSTSRVKKPIESTAREFSTERPLQPSMYSSILDEPVGASDSPSHQNTTTSAQVLGIRSQLKTTLMVLVPDIPTILNASSSSESGRPPKPPWKPIDISSIKQRENRDHSKFSPGSEISTVQINPKASATSFRTRYTNCKEESRPQMLQQTTKNFSVESRVNLAVDSEVKPPQEDKVSSLLSNWYDLRKPYSVEPDDGDKGLFLKDRLEPKEPKQGLQSHDSQISERIPRNKHSKIEDAKVKERETADLVTEILQQVQIRSNDEYDEHRDFLNQQPAAS